MSGTALKIREIPGEGTIVFVSDVHLGLRVGDPDKREKRFAGMLRSLPENTRALFLMGDIFDFWFEYKYVVPKGFTRTLAAIADLSEKGVQIFFFRGNHDLWTFGYLEQETGLEVVEQPFYIRAGNRVFCLGHGDGLAKGDYGYKIMNAVFSNRILQKLFSNIHPRWTLAFAHSWSSHNRLTKGRRYSFKGREEPLYEYSSMLEKSNPADFFIFGHYHACGETITPAGGRFYILGEWIHGCDYLVYDTESDKMEWRSGAGQ